jgi:hypothetical protein
MAIDVIALRNVYPAMGRGESIGQLGTPDVSVEAGPTGAPQVDRALAVGGQASPLAGLLVFAALVAAIMLVAQRVGGPEEFRNIRASAYNVLLISLIAVAGIPVWKFLFTRFPVPGVSAWVHAV